MATLIDVDRVKYLCSCKRLKPLSSLYYCKYCKPFALKCKECVLHEIDQKYFCANCFDNKTQNEANTSKFKCMNCFACPICKNSLMMRASSGTAAQKAAMKAASLEAEKNKGSAAGSTPQSDPTSPVSSPAPVPTVATKVYYLMCSFCRWTTRDVSIPDVTTIKGNWPLPENPHTERIKELLGAYKVVSAREKAEKDRKKYTTPKRRTFHTTTASAAVSAFTGGVSSSSSLHSDKYGILSPASRRLKSMSSPGNSSAGQAQDSSLLSIELQMKSLLVPPETVCDFDGITPEDFFTETNVNSITSIDQRHANPEVQPTRSVNLFPLNKFYVNKESKRCNGCEHNVLKPESNITSIRFKLHQMALFVVPDIRICTIPEWKLNQPNEVILTVTNKSEIDLNVAFVSLENVENQLENLSCFSTNAAVSFEENNEKIILIERQDNQVQRAQGASLKPEDLETKGFVCFRRDNKIAISFKVTPKSETLGDCDDFPHVRIAFGMKHCLDNKAVSESSTSKDISNTPRQTILQKVFIDFGPLRIEDGLVPVSRPKYIHDLNIISK